MTHTGGTNPLVYWWNGLSLPNSAHVTKNTSTTSQTFLTVIQPASVLNLDPQSESDIVRWTAPSAGDWSISGLFQGIDVDQHSHPVEIVENGTTVLLAPTSIGSYGQVVKFSDTVVLAKGDTIDFMVSTGSTFTNLSTGFDATIQSAVPEPSSLLLGVLATLGTGVFARFRRDRSRGAARPATR